MSVSPVCVNDYLTSRSIEMHSVSQICFPILRRKQILEHAPPSEEALGPYLFLQPVQLSYFQMLKSRILPESPGSDQETVPTLKLWEISKISELYGE